jgi:ABC-2 type transport system ATP-binding protein
LYIGGEGHWAALPFAERVIFDEEERASLVFLRQGVTPDDAFRLIAQQPNLHVDRFEVALPSLDDIFIEVVEGQRRPGGNGANGRDGQK